MVSRANLSGRRSGGGILGRVQRGPQNPAQDPSRAGIRPGRGGITDRATTQPVEGPNTGVMAGMQKNVAMRDRKDLAGRKPSRPRSTLYDVAETRGPQISAGLIDPSQAVEPEPEVRGPRGRPGRTPPGRQTPPTPGADIPSTIARREPVDPVETPPKTLAEWAQRRQDKAGYQTARDEYTPPSSGLMAGVAESLGSAYVNPYDAARHARGGFANPETEPGGNTTQTPARRPPRTPRPRR